MKSRDKTLPKDVVAWLDRMGFAPEEGVVAEADVKMLCRGNFVPIWEFLLERVRSAKVMRRRLCSLPLIQSHGNRRWTSFAPTWPPTGWRLRPATRASVCTTLRRKRCCNKRQSCLRPSR
jgi:hypothetical protein